MDDYEKMYLEIRYDGCVVKDNIVKCIDDFAFFEKRNGRTGIVILDITEGEMIAIMANLTTIAYIESVRSYDYHVVITIDV